MSNRKSEGEQGYVLLAVIFLTVILLVSLAIAAPKIAISIQRDKEMETIHRGEQYKRALKLYYQKFGTYPTSVDQLVETNEMRFLRKRYADPLTGKDDWKPVYFGQAHVRPLGFFGQPLMTAGLSGASMYAATASTTTDANGVPIASPDQPGTSANGGTSGSPGSAFGSSGSSFGSSGSSFGSSGSSFGSSGSSFGSSGSSYGSSGSSFGSSGSSFGSQSPGSSTFGSSTPTSTPGSSTGAPFGSSGSGTSATTFGGGGPIVGFTLPVDKPSLIEYKLQKRYNKWEFNYDPMEDQAQALSGLGGGAGSTTNTTGNPTGTQSPFGNAPGQLTPGSLPSNPTTNPTAPAAPTDPTAPQQ
jgi:type II secretory pathway pseudopilin PulG